jgi:hypothetical protein
MRTYCLRLTTPLYSLLASYLFFRINSSETSVIYQITKHHNPENSNLHICDRKILKFNLSCTISQRHFFFLWGETVHTVLRQLSGLLYQPQMIDDDECGAVCGMRICRGIRSIRMKPVPVPLCPPQIPHDLPWARTRPAAVGSRRLTAWAMARPTCI